MHWFRQIFLKKIENDITIYLHQIENGDYPKKSKVLEAFQIEYQSGGVGNPAWYRLMLEYGSTNIARNPAYDLPYQVRKVPIRY